MANSRKSTPNYEYAEVDTAPAEGSGGYWTDSVHIKAKGKPVYFSIREISSSVAQVTLQFKCPEDSEWTSILNNGSAFAVGDRVLISDLAANVLYRAGVEESNFTSGSIIFGFDW